MARKHGFTLIELLIVVAIIAILAAIAVPNFLEAQVRSKVSRMKSDLRTVATALESYVVDHNNYPITTYNPYNPPAGTWPLQEQWKIFPGYPSEGMAGSLTTPIAYLSSRAAAQDVFRKAHKFESELAYEIMYLPSNFYSTDTAYTGIKSDATFAAQSNRYGTYVIRSAGPDTWYQNHPGRDGDYDLGGWNLASYDATNGTVSAGDIYRSQKRPDEDHR